ncbi:preprotein translocase SecY subunit [Synechococcus sp. A18-25c]|uniref:preprotein translocase subunit SecY n=1 Tax=unclassified Synechococcus TaxID=2626047 RepID=UPI000C3D5D72|nr:MULTISPECIES: preprotein translocase subunit SecY [unclassified Synechococcus]MAN19867.1 preprotein translocase subunit SecY [Synechococcus sp. EAC657]MEC7248351.1 preprotein translocase subunit SecY [Cyanobacteriota bacterium]MEC7897451.1 preprotein translocase subunit SecY [Cyanobacteriota bacterium]QNI47139.1 preprotein translocase SecY subunit [Synechococcus sp. A15-60]QNJ18758.1 preprotein translocase SecY subunit [Synechococcus sp. A18-25c]|tara:strand:+ start:1590 stop:2909 length:1320 start_codon:yes stop_codon:yes gene_type:complete
MLVSRGRNPSAAEVITQLVQNPELRGRVLTTLGLLMLIRLGIYIPMPGIDRIAFQSFIEQGGQLIGFLDIFTGGGISTLGVFALGILPFINASIILQLLTASLPQLEDLQKNEGEAGRRKLAQITRYVALGWGLIQSIIFAMILRPYAVEGLSELVFVAQTALALVTGSMVVMWLSEVITERGIGQGASLVIFLNIVATLPKALGSTIEKAQTGDRNDVFGIVILVLVFLITIVGIIFVQEGQRRLPIVSAKRQVGGGAVLPNRQSYLPLKLNAGGVMPIIFASALIFLPLTLANVSNNPFLIKAASALNPGGPNAWIYALVFFSLILGFSYFYASLTFNPVDVASNLKRGGVAIPGVRPGTATATYLEGVKNRLTLLGGLFLGAVAIIPSAVERATGVTTFQGLGATSLLILVGVAIDTAKQVQTYVISQRYEGLVRQ